MKQCISAIIILAVIISFCTITSLYTTDFCNELSLEISDCTKAIKNADWSNAKMHLTAANTILAVKAQKIKMFSAHQELSDIHNSISKLNESIFLENTDICLSEVETIQSLLKKISEYDNLTIENIL